MRGGLWRQRRRRQLPGRRRGGSIYGLRGGRRLRGVAGGDDGFGASRGVVFGRRPCAARNKDARGVGCFASTPTRRVSKCFVGPLPDKTGPPNSPLVFYRVVIGPGFYTPKPAQTQSKNTSTERGLMISANSCYYSNHIRIIVYDIFHNSKKIIVE
jgi:hypothetical protein